MKLNTEKKHEENLESRLANLQKENDALRSHLGIVEMQLNISMECGAKLTKAILDGGEEFAQLKSEIEKVASEVRMEMAAAKGNN